MYLLDTNIISNLLKKSPSPNLIQILAKIPADQQATTAVNVGELVYGAYLLPHSETLLSRINGLLNTFKILPFDHDSSRIFGKLKAQLKKKGITVAEADLRIGSIALNHRLTVVTGNVRHFSLIPDLSVENWL